MRATRPGPPPRESRGGARPAWVLERRARASTGGAAAGLLEPSGTAGAPESLAFTGSSAAGSTAAGSGSFDSSCSPRGSSSAEEGAATGAVGVTGGGVVSDEAAGAPPEGEAGVPPAGTVGAPPAPAVLDCGPRRKSRPPGLTRTSSGGPGCPRRSMCVPRSSWKRFTTSVKLSASPGPLSSRLSRSLSGRKCSGAQRRSRP